MSNHADPLIESYTSDRERPSSNTELSLAFAGPYVIARASTSASSFAWEATEDKKATADETEDAPADEI